MQISTVHRPSTWLKGSVKVPQNEQCGPTPHLPARTGVREATQPSYPGAFARAGFAWAEDPQGYQIGGSFLKLTPRDLAKFGYLYLKDGRWEGRQLIPAGYVRASTQVQSRPPGPAQYGYHWWVVTQPGPPGFFARGFGGQYLVVLPGLDLVVVITCDEAFRPDRDVATALIGEVILPATTK